MKKAILILTLVFLQACGDATLAPDNTSKITMPLKAGNYWKTEYKFAGSNTVDTLILKCLNDTLLNSEKWWVMNYNTGGLNSSPQPNFYLINKSDGMYRIDKNNNDYLENLLYKFPPKEGEVNVTFNSMKITALNLDTTITVKNKEYKNTIVYIATRIYGSRITSFYQYVCPNIGLVKTDMYTSDSNIPKTLVSTEELFEYKIN